MLLTKYLGALLAFGVAQTLCSPTPVQMISHEDLAALRAQGKTSNSLVRRQGAAGAILDVVGIILDVADAVWGWISDLNDDQHAQEEAFTQGVVSRLRSQYPNSNVLVFHDPDGVDQYELYNAAYQHYELPLEGPFDQTEGYEIFVFDYGWFQRNYDGGYINWCYSGYCQSNDENSYVEFYTISSSKRSVFGPSTSPFSPPAPPSAHPVPPFVPAREYREDPTVEDGTYFVNCNATDGTLSSGVAYYKNLNPGENAGQQPDAYVEVSHGSYYNWEKAGSVSFKDSGAIVNWNIFGQSGNRTANSSCGTAGNGRESFWVYRDAGEWLFTEGDSQCYAAYWSY